MQDSITVVIIDDEEPGSDFILKLLEEFCPQAKVLGVANSIASGVKAIREHRPGLVFLDIHMPGGTGFDILDQVENLDFEVVFTTAFDQYAIKAFRLSALDYLLKPVDAEELMEAIDKAMKKRNNPGELQAKFDLLVQNIQQREGLNQIALPTFDGFAIVELQNIIRCESDGAYTKVVLHNQPNMLVSKMLKEIESLLGNDVFIRIHRSHLINKNFVRSYIRTDGGQVEMADGSSVPISRRKKDDFLGNFKSMT